MTSVADHPFCRFSVNLYGKDGVAPACLELQDRHGLDVNLLLFCFWQACERITPVACTVFEHVIAETGEWHHEVVTRLRGARRRLKLGSPRLPEALTNALRERVLAAEIDCELAEQRILAAAATDAPSAEAAEPVYSPAARAVTNIRTYAAVDGIAFGEDDRPALRTIFAACFSESDAAVASVEVIGPNSPAPTHGGA